MNKKIMICSILIALIILTIMICINIDLLNSLTWKKEYCVILIFPFLLLAMVLVVKYSKKTLKVILASIIAIITLYCIIFSIDINMVANFRKPIFIWETNSKNDITTNEVTYQGLGYIVKRNIKYLEDGKMESESITMYMFDKEITGFSSVCIYSK